MQRGTQYSYNPAAFLEFVTDAAGRSVSFEYDLVGWVTRQTFPDFSYDANGNLTSIVPPGREARVFTYTSVNQEESYGDLSCDCVIKVARTSVEKAELFGSENLAAPIWLFWQSHHRRGSRRHRHPCVQRSRLRVCRADCPGRLSPALRV